MDLSKQRPSFFRLPGQKLSVFLHKFCADNTVFHKKQKRKTAFCPKDWQPSRYSAKTDPAMRYTGTIDEKTIVKKLTYVDLYGLL